MVNFIFAVIIGIAAQATTSTPKPETIQRLITTKGKYQPCGGYDDFVKYMDYLPSLLPPTHEPEKLMNLSLTLMSSCDSSFADFQQIAENLKRWNLPKPLVLTVLLDAFSQPDFQSKLLLTATSGPFPESLKKLPTMDFVPLIQYFARHKKVDTPNFYTRFFFQAGQLYDDCQNYLDGQTISSCNKLVPQLMQRYHWYHDITLLYAMKELRQQLSLVPNLLNYSRREIYGITFNVVLQGPAATRNYIRFINEQKYFAPATSKKKLEDMLDMALKVAQKSYKITFE